MHGSAIRQDGRSASLTAPNGQAQQGGLGASFSDASLPVVEAAAIEAHGTGTALGDPIEAGALAAVFLSRWKRAEEPLVVSSLKANAGHTEPGAGLAGASKLLMQLRSALAVPNAQLRTLNPHVRGVAASALPTQPGGLRAANGGVSSFGYSGTIAHATLRSSVEDSRLACG